MGPGTAVTSWGRKARIFSMSQGTEAPDRWGGTRAEEALGGRKPPRSLQEVTSLPVTPRGRFAARLTAGEAPVGLWREGEVRGRGLLSSRDALQGACP